MPVWRGLDPAGEQRWTVYDEAWRLMSHPPLLRRMKGLWRIKDRSFVVQNQLHPGELALFDTAARMTSKTEPEASEALQHFG